MTGAKGRLPQGQRLRLPGSGAEGIVGAPIGAGSQGTVYRCDVGGRPVALKWYHPEVAEGDAGLRARIDRLVAAGPPDRRFLWPIDRADILGRDGVGYVMPLVSPDLRPLGDILAPPPGRLALALASCAVLCFEIAESFGRLHAAGLCYQDVNFGGFFVDPLRGAVLICDADNITVEGGLGGVYGTRKFMAPEIVRRDALPSRGTDLYSLSVLFFYVLFGSHPLEGRRATGKLDRAAEARLYGTEPLFVFDPVDPANGPVAGLHDAVAARWRAMPGGLRSLFTRAFTAGLGPGDAERVTETEWLTAFSRLLDAALTCGACGRDAPLDPEAIPGLHRCAACDSPMAHPARMAFPHRTVVLLPGRELFRHHVEPGAAPSLAEAVGRLDSHPADAAKLGLHNLSTGTWQGRLPDGRQVGLAPGRTLRILDGLEVDFGRRRGTVAAAEGVQEPSP